MVIKRINMFNHGEEIRLLTLAGLKDIVDKAVGSLESKEYEKVKGFRPSVAEKIRDNSNDGKLHIAIKKKKLKFNLND